MTGIEAVEGKAERKKEALASGNLELKGRQTVSETEEKEKAGSVRKKKKKVIEQSPTHAVGDDRSTKGNLMGSKNNVKTVKAKRHQRIGHHQ